MPTRPPVVGIVGLAALRRDLRRASTDVSGPLYQAIKAAGKDAVEPVAALTRAGLPTAERETPRMGRLAGSVRTSGTRTGGAVRMGSKAIAWAGWVEFGGARPDGSRREYVATGRYLFPAARGLAETAAGRYAVALEHVFASDRLWTNTTSDGARVHD